MEFEIKLNNFVIRFSKVGNDQLWIAIDRYEDQFEEDPEDGFSSDWHETLREAVQCLCKRIEVAWGNEVAVEIAKGIRKKLMFNKAPHWLLTFAIKDRDLYLSF
jgi:hypothetical protein